MEKCLTSAYYHAQNRFQIRYKQFFWKNKINDLGVGKHFLNKTYKALILKENMEKLDYIAIKNYSSKGNNN